MVEKNNIQQKCCVMNEDTTCCEVDAVVTIDRRGQIILPKEVRDKAEMKAGDRFAVISCECEGEVCCLILVKTATFNESAKDMLNQMLKGIQK